MLVFLDIDGVMVPANSWKRPEILVDDFPAFSALATQALQKIIVETKAELILTTSHKSKYSIEEWIGIFELRGIKLDNIARLPENITNMSRKDEIVSWFNVSKINGDFAIIDDDKSLNDLPPFLKDRLILTTGAIGLTWDLAAVTINLSKQKLAYT